MKFNKQDSRIMNMSKTIVLDNRGAVALVMVVWVMVVLMAIVGEFAFSMRTEVNMARNFKEEEQAYHMALGGIEKAKVEILSARQSDVVFLNEGGMLVFNDDVEEEAPVRKETIGNISFEYTINDEDSKLNINTASLEQLKFLLDNVGIDSTEVDTIADSIVDWRDPNEDFHLNGAEEDYYQSLPQPYSCKDGPFDSIEELLLVKGITPEILYGSKGDEETEATEGIARYLTVNDIGSININTAPVIVLETVLGMEAAGNITIQRETGPITRPQSNGKVSSSFFTVISTGTNADGIIKRTVKAVIRKNNKGLETVYWNDNII